MQAHREWWRKDSDCKFYGVMVPYVRDWPETIKHGDVEMVIPPVPDTTAGQEIVFTKKVCEGKPDEPILLVDDVQRANSSWSAGVPRVQYRPPSAGYIIRC
jgi:hypothetical protein